MKPSAALVALSLSVIVPATVSPSAYIDKPIVLLPEYSELNNSTMKANVMVVALGLACAGCQTTGSVVESNSTSSIVGLVALKAQEHRVPTPLAQAVISVESGYKPNVVSQGNYGLGQIRCGTARSVGFTGNCRDLLKPDINLEYTMRYLRLAIDRANGDWCKAATVYNGGPPGRSAYCRKVMARVDKPL
jgi:soluble lytic murein transglycosylase-like protein